MTAARGIRFLFATTAGFLAVVLVNSGCGVAPAYAGPNRAGPPRAQAAPASVPLRAAPTWAAARPGPEDVAAVRSAPAVTWPAPGAVEVDRPGSGATPARVGSLPVWVAGQSGAATRRSDTTADRVRVEVLDQAAARRAGVPGVLVRLASGGATAGARAAVAPLDVEFDYSGFRNAYGGDWAARLGVVRLPECVLSTPEVAGCARGEPVPSRNDTRTARVGARVETGLFAVTAASGGSSGSFQPTSLAPSAAWSVGLESGDFGWQYPMSAPEMPGLTPGIALGYSSGAVDGRTASTNNQPSWAGEGFDLQGGFIERSYVACKEDGQAGSEELCWRSDNATVSLPGMSGELVLDDTSGQWHAEHDEGWRIERLTDANAGNGDNDGEHWKLTSPDGTRYFFGSAPAANSTWTVPVYGNNVAAGKNEPCHQSTFAASWCQQAYRWNLDYVVDRHGDAMAYFYQRETNNYARGGGTATPYTRGGYLDRIEYGLRTDSAAPASARVVFSVADRCVPGSTCTQAQPQNWPDTPWDRACAGTPCQVVSPTFWISKRLARVTTQVRSGGSYQDVESWTLTHSFPATGDITTASLWLDSIVRTGHVGGTASLPPTTFTGERRANRVDTVDDNGDAPMNKWRLVGVTNETGGQVRISYTEVPCTRSALPAPDQNAGTCFPAFWGRSGAVDPQLDWFRKFVVSQVVEDDRLVENPDEITQYEYVGAAAWHHDDTELTPNRFRTWGQWRGFQRVVVRTGDPNGGEQTRTEHLFLRGMHGDRTTTGTRDVKVTDSTGKTKVDEAYWRGFAREVTEYNGTSGAWTERTISEPTMLATTAARDRRDGTQLKAYLVEELSQREYVALADGTERVTESVQKFDSNGTLEQTNDLGDIATDADDTCTDYTYTSNRDAWIIDAESRVRTVGVRCGADVSYPGDLLSDQRYYYDDSKTWGAPPTTGDVTAVEKLASWSNGPVYVSGGSVKLDKHGRTTTATDALGNTDQVTFTPAVGGPVTRVTTANALGHASTVDLDPLLGDATATVDANGRRTELSYDPLGRVVAAWAPGRSRSAGDSPHAKFAYLVRNNGASAVTTSTLRPNGAYRDSHSIMDGFLRARQTQTPSATGGRLVTDTFHNSRGEVVKTNPAYWNSAAPSTTLVAPPADSNLAAQNRYLYDGSGRQTAEILVSRGVEKWRTTTTYGGNWTAVDPPDGETPTMEIFDADGQAVELRQYTGTGPTGPYDATHYTYTRSGEQATITDPAGNTWRYGYDLRDRKIRAEDPDTGTNTFTYDNGDRLVSSTDSRGRTLVNTYDALDRRTAVHEGSATGTKLSEWTYDSLPGGKGLPVAAKRFVGADVYSSEALGYLAATGLPTGTRVTVPASETGLGGSYDTTIEYDPSGRITRTTLPAAGGLGAETLTQGYDPSSDLPSTLSGLAQYVAGTSYDRFGDVSSVTLGAAGSQVWQSYQRDEVTRRLASTSVIRETDDDPQVSARSYTWDPAGNLLSVTDAPDGVTADTQCFRADYLRRMTEAWTPASGDCAAAPTTAALGGPAPYWHSYRYDKVGNRLGEVQHAATGDTTRTYGYPDAGSAQPHTLRSVATTGPGGSRTDTFGYDSDGNTTARTVAGRTQALDWDAEGHLVSVTENGTTTDYLYDAEGNRILSRDRTGTTVYLGSTELRREAGSGLVNATRYYSQGGGTFAVRTGTGSDGLSWLVSDHHSTADTAIRADTLAVTRRYSLPFGESRGAKPTTWPGQRGFVGGSADPTGLVHLGAREYDPATGRFLSVDPVIDDEDPQQMHGYAYANNSPATYADADGLRACANEKCTTFTQPNAAKKSSAAAAAARARQIQAAQWKARADALRKKYLAEQKAAARARKIQAQQAKEYAAAMKRKYLADKKAAAKARKIQAQQWKEKAAAMKKKYLADKASAKAQSAKTRKESGCTGHNGCGAAGKAKPKGAEFPTKDLLGLALDGANGGIWESSGAGEGRRVIDWSKSKNGYTAWETVGKYGKVGKFAMGSVSGGANLAIGVAVDVSQGKSGKTVALHAAANVVAVVAGFGAGLLATAACGGLAICGVAAGMIVGFGVGKVLEGASDHFFGDD
ncbi:RHS repeat-associated core domain-containing protein [Micromonospora sp. NPDC049230]|uniref:RHS repeat-associated core domain-containing protein n=1 Tax=Micromonospora sp. NPDC049230 TaxID=3155502 RepID=UPI0033FE1785